MIENHPYDELQIGQQAEYRKTVTAQDILLFAVVSGDANPVHLDEDFAKGTVFKERIAHGMLTGSLVSAALAMRLPGPGSIYVSQSLRFRRPVRIDDTLTVQLTISEKRDDKKLVTLDCKIVNQNGEAVASGTAEVIAPTEKLQLQPANLPSVQINP